MKLDRHLNVRFEQDISKLRSNNLVKYYNDVKGEFDTDYVEIVSRKQSITDTVPGNLFESNKLVIILLSFV